MDIIKSNVIMRLNSEERQTLNKACELLNQIADKLDKNNYFWFIIEKTGMEFNISELREMAEALDMLGSDSDRIVY